MDLLSCFKSENKVFSEVRREDISCFIKCYGREPDIRDFNLEINSCEDK